MRLIDADELKKCAIPCETQNGALTDLCVPLYQIDNAPTVIRPDWGIDNGDKTAYARPTGEWIKTPVLFKDRICSHCKRQISYEQIGDFCIKCGAKMKGEAEND